MDSCQRLCITHVPTTLPTDVAVGAVPHFAWLAPLELCVVSLIVQLLAPIQLTCRHCVTVFVQRFCVELLCFFIFSGHSIQTCLTHLNRNPNKTSHHPSLLPLHGHSEV